VQRSISLRGTRVDLICVNWTAAIERGRIITAFGVRLRRGFGGPFNPFIIDHIAMQAALAHDPAPGAIAV
jgi:hypothetical protein